MTRVADTSALYAFFSQDDAHHDRAVDAMADPEPILVPDAILVETIDLLAYRFGKHAGPSALGDLLSLPHVRIAAQVPIEGVAELYRSMRGKLSLADAYVVQTCRVHGARPITFDKNMEAAARP